jgi:predicted RecB family nuclease
MASTTSLENCYLITIGELKRYLKCPQALYLIASGRLKYPTREEELAASGFIPPVATGPATDEDVAKRFLSLWWLYRARRFGDSCTADGIHAWYVNGDLSWRFMAYADPTDPFTFRFTVEGSQIEIKYPHVRGPLSNRASVHDCAPFEINYRTLENTEVGIRGRPFAVDPAGGAMLPAIGVWSFGLVTKLAPTSYLELAFHWLLMEPYRSKPSPRIAFLKLLESGQEAFFQEVELEDRHIEEVKRLVVKIRQVLRDGVPPRVCSCAVCDYKGILRPPILDEIRNQAHNNKHISILKGVGPARINQLEEMGIFSIDQLQEMEASKKPSKKRPKKSAQQAHIESYQNNTPIVFGDVPLVPDSFIVLDLEYDATIWIVGFCVVRAGRQPEYHLLWADSTRSARQEKANLKELAGVAEAEPSLPIITWNGTSADIPALKKAAERLKLGDLFSGVYSRHRDLFREFDKAVRLPRKKMGVDDVASWFGFQRRSGISKASQAIRRPWYCHTSVQDTYLEYRLSMADNDAPMADAQTLKANLLEYNRDDLDALTFIIGKIPDLQPQQSVP